MSIRTRALGAHEINSDEIPESSPDAESYQYPARAALDYGKGRH